MLAEIIAAGSELLTPFRQDTNSLFLTAELNKLGVQVAFKTIVGDHRARLTAAIATALARADIVILSGGLGPTEDDLTRECVADALGVECYRDPAIIAALYKRFAELKIVMPASNEKQAERIDGAELLTNANGSAPGQWLDTIVSVEEKSARRIVILLPGPPNELKPMFATECAPRLAATLPPRFLATRMLRLALQPESSIDAIAAPIYKQFEDVDTSILAGHAEIQLHFSCAKDSLEAAEARVEELAEKIEAELGDDIFSAHGEPLEEIVILLLGLHNQTLSVAESCTGGWLAERLTSVVNSSRNFFGGAIVYSDALKTKLCNVPASLIEQHGAISEEAARALAEGIRRATGTSLGVSITGIAGPTPPGGADADKPIGLVYIALAGEDGTQVKRLNIRGDRERIRFWSTQHALELLRRHFP